MLDLTRILSNFDPSNGSVAGLQSGSIRRLADLRGSFADEKAYERLLAQSNPVLYEVTAVPFANTEGALHYAAGCLYPGKIGDEYYLTKGHFHAWRAASEIYVGLQGEGVMLLEGEDPADNMMVPMRPNSVIYVPGYVAHRTMNTGSTPLTYLGIYPYNAGHDYGTIATNNMRNVVVERDGRPVMMERQSYLKYLLSK